MHDVCSIVRVGANPSKGPGQCCLRRYALAQEKRALRFVNCWFEVLHVWLPKEFYSGTLSVPRFHWLSAV